MFGIPTISKTIVVLFQVNLKLELYFQIIRHAKKKNSNIFGAKKNASLYPKIMNAKNPMALQMNNPAAVFLAILSFHFRTRRNSKKRYQISKILSKKWYGALGWKVVLNKSKIITSRESANIARRAPVKGNLRITNGTNIRERMISVGINSRSINVERS